MGSSERGILDAQVDAIRAAIERADANENPIERMLQLERLYEALDAVEEDPTTIQGENE
jgi:hypothetical protein